MKKIPIHSVASLITNSSTIIYTNSENTIEPFKKLINEVLKLIGENKSCDDVFKLKIEKDSNHVDDDILCYFEENVEELKPFYPKLYDKDNAIDEKKLNNIVKNIRSGKMLKPHWWDNAVNEDEQCNTYLKVTAKDPKYKKLAKLVIDFLYSTESVEGYE